MTIDDGARLALHRKLEDVLGSENAETLMSHLPPVTWQQVATKDDLAQLSTRLEARIETATSEVRGEVVALRGEFDAFRGELRGELQAGLAELRGEMHGELGWVRGDLGELRGQFGELRGELHLLKTELTSTIDRAITAQTWRLTTFVAAWGALIVAVVGLMR